MCSGNSCRLGPLSDPGALTAGAKGVPNAGPGALLFYVEGSVSIFVETIQALSAALAAVLCRYCVRRRRAGALCLAWLAA